MGYYKFFLFLFSVFFSGLLTAQNYQAINGSVYAGSVSPGSNPAAIVHVPYSWDITPLAFQFKQSTNAYVIKGFSLLSPSGNAIAENSYGIKNRFAFGNVDIRLLNTRINLNGKSAIAFGANLRTYYHAVSGKSNYQDTTYSLADFQRINLGYQPMDFDMAAMGWAEVYGSYARTILDDGYKILNVGVTIKYNKSLAGGYAFGNNIQYRPDTDTNNLNGFILTNGALQYGYASTIDAAQHNGSFSTNRFLKSAYTNFSGDIGLEYIFLSTDEADDNDSYAYKTKLGISVMDIGGNRYQQSSKGRMGSSVKSGMNDTILENKFRDVRDIDDFNDSLATIANTLQVLRGDFVMYKPTRLVVNVDHRIRPNIFINAELTLPVISLAGNNTLYVKDMNLLAITPRYETSRLGAYLPLLVNMRTQIWVGAALRAGPLLLGVHSLANIFSKNKMQNGGMYLALTIHPGKSRDRLDDENSAAKNAQLRRLKCTAF